MSRRDLAQKLEQAAYYLGQPKGLLKEAADQILEDEETIKRLEQEEPKTAAYLARHKAAGSQYSAVYLISAKNYEEAKEIFSKYGPSTYEASYDIKPFTESLVPIATILEV